MPTISIFIRKDDLPIWRALENKSEWLHNSLSTSKTIDYDTPPKERFGAPILLKKEDEITLEELVPHEATCPQHHVSLSICGHKH